MRHTRDTSGRADVLVDGAAPYIETPVVGPHTAIRQWHAMMPGVHMPYEYFSNAPALQRGAPTPEGVAHSVRCIPHIEGTVNMPAFRWLPRHDVHPAAEGTAFRPLSTRAGAPDPVARTAFQRLPHRDPHEELLRLPAMTEDISYSDAGYPLQSPDQSTAENGAHFSPCMGRAPMGYGVGKNMQFMPSSPSSADNLGTVYRLPFWCSQNLPFRHVSSFADSKVPDDLLRLWPPLDKHLETHAFARISKPKSQPMCSFPGCGQRLASRSSLRRHMKRHAGIRPWSCTICLRQFSEKTSLQRHLPTHSPSHHPYQCSLRTCGRGFKERAALFRHEETHMRGSKDATPKGSSDSGSVLLDETERTEDIPTSNSKAVDASSGQEDSTGAISPRHIALVVHRGDAPAAREGSKLLYGHRPDDISVPVISCVAHGFS